MRLDKMKSYGQSLSWPLVIFVFLSLMGSPLLNKLTLLLGISYLLILNYKGLYTIGLHSLKAWGLLLLMLFDVFSITWSETQRVSTLNVMNDVGILMFAMLAAYHAQNKDVVASIKLVFTIVIALLALYCILFPGDAYTSHGLRSFYGQKNNLGYTAGISSIVMIMTLRKHWIDYVTLFVSALLLLLSQSKTSIALVIAVLLLVTFVYWFSIYFNHLSKFTQGFISILLKALLPLSYAMVGLVLFFRERIADFIMLNIPYEALTGRGMIWATVLTRTRNELLIGLGRGSFWGAGMESEINQTHIGYQQRWLTELSSADGGYVDVIGSLGFIGLALFLVAIVQAYSLNFAAIKKVHWTLYFALITFFVFHNITETDVFKFTNMMWFMFMFLTFYVLFKQTVTSTSETLFNRKGQLDG